MEQLKFTPKIKALFHKYKFVLLIVFTGIILMLWPTPKNNSDETESIPEDTTVQPQEEQQLENVLCQIKGAGRVSVMLSIATGEETIYQLNTDYADSQERKDTVVISDADRAERGLISQVNPVKYLGAIVVCDGADDPTVRLNIVDAVSKITGLNTSCISVLKMK